MDANHTNRQFEKALGYGFGSFLLACGGFGCVLLAMHWLSRVLLVLGAACVVVGILSGIGTMLYGWWVVLLRPRIQRRRGNV